MKNIVHTCTKYLLAKATFSLLFSNLSDSISCSACLSEFFGSDATVCLNSENDKQLPFGVVKHADIVPQWLIHCHWQRAC